MGLQTVSKAIAGIVVAVLSKYLVDNDILIDATELGAAVEYGIAAAIGFVIVYLSPKNKE